MAESKKKTGIDEAAAPAGVQSVTMETPAEADKVSEPNASDAKPQDPPVRTVDPQVPIAQTLAAGAGEHKPETDPHIGADGRFYADPDEAPKAPLVSAEPES